jgi:hypothetical protein
VRVQLSDNISGSRLCDPEPLSSKSCYTKKTSQLTTKLSSGVPAISEQLPMPAPSAEPDEWIADHEGKGWQQFIGQYEVRERCLLNISTALTRKGKRSPRFQMI